MKKIQESMRGEVLLYKNRVEVKLEAETVWLNQGQMATLFGKSKQNISLHILNLFKENELEERSVVKEYLTTASDGKKYKTKGHLVYE